MTNTIFEGKSRLISSIIVGFIGGIVLYGSLVPQIINADIQNTGATIKPATLIKDGHLTICKLDKSAYHVVRIIKIVVATAYSSSWDETTGIPGKPGLITASGKYVADGLVAYNHLPFGTKLRISAPGFEDRILEVADRTARGRKNLDIWMNSKQEALNFGAQVVRVEILES